MWRPPTGCLRDTEVETTNRSNSMLCASPPRLWEMQPEEDRVWRPGGSGHEKTCSLANLPIDGEGNTSHDSIEWLVPRLFCPRLFCPWTCNRSRTRSICGGLSILPIAEVGNTAPNSNERPLSHLFCPGKWNRRWRYWSCAGQCGQKNKDMCLALFLGDTEVRRKTRDSITWFVPCLLLDMKEEQDEANMLGLLWWSNSQSTEAIAVAVRFELARE